MSKLRVSGHGLELSFLNITEQTSEVLLKNKVVSCLEFNELHNSADSYVFGFSGNSAVYLDDQYIGLVNSLIDPPNIDEGLDKLYEILNRKYQDSVLVFESNLSGTFIDAEIGNYKSAKSFITNFRKYLRSDGYPNIFYLDCWGKKNLPFSDYTILDSTLRLLYQGDESMIDIEDF